jgi:hypothetical protein
MARGMGDTVLLYIGVQPVAINGQYCSSAAYGTGIAAGCSVLRCAMLMMQGYVLPPLLLPALLLLLLPTHLRSSLSCEGLCRCVSAGPDVLPAVGASPVAAMMRQSLVPGAAPGRTAPGQHATTLGPPAAGCS